MKSARVGEKRRSMTTGGRRLRNRAIGSRLQWLMLTCAATTSAMATSQLAAAADIDRDDATASALSRSWATETPAHQFSAFSPADGPGSRPRSGRPPETAIAASEGPNSNIPEDAQLKRREQDIKVKELDVREREVEKAMALESAPWWRRGLDPLVLAIIAAALAMIGNMIVALTNNRANLEQEETRSANALAQEKQKADAALELEKQKARYTLVLQAIETGDPAVAEQNIKFFINAALLEDEDRHIALALEKFRPVLPSSGGAVPPRPRAAPEIAKIYNFPPELDGGGQIVGLRSSRAAIAPPR